ncbi:VOC family protein [Polaribacter pectinis]|uniref:VOC family protein n=1 Tax=Polaribacter pectinis TaxID=2738844 RepID=A0A7G9LDG2_9FLAO|nr:VOC family protein [Polaribacter pectinis]QNM86661.1 VOC family protein [Polaribacter pectinis]
MNIRNYFIIFFLIFNLLSCKNKNNAKKPDEVTKNTPSDLQVDHFNIWVTNPKKAKEKLTEIGFTSVPDSLSAIHKGQGTAGRYFHFLNGYLELIFVYDLKELKDNNLINNDLGFTKRANFQKNGASPFSIALKVKNYDVDKIPFEKVAYHQDWMEENTNIFSAKNSKTHLNEPSIFVVYPEIESPTFESIKALENTPSEDSYWKSFYKHPNGAKKITRLIITSKNLDLKTTTIKAVNGIENVTVKKGKEHLMELYFDNNVQGKTFDLRPELPLIINL